MTTQIRSSLLEAIDPRSGSTSQQMQILDELPAAVYVTDSEGYVTYFNRAAVRFSGRVPELGRDRWCVSWKLYHADGSPMPHDQCPMAITLQQQREVAGVEAIAERPDGQRIPFMPYPTLLRDEHGTVIGAVNMLVDLTERNRERESHRVSEERHQRLLGLLPAAVYTCEAPSGEITFYNEQAAALWGRKPRLRSSDQRFCGSFKLWLADGTPLPPDQTPMALALRQGLETRNQDLVIERPDGTRISVLVNIDPIRDAGGSVVGAVNVFIDTTPLKQAERELERRTNQLAAFLETAVVGLHRVGPDGTILWANEAELELLGYSRDEYIGHHIAEFHADQAVIEDILNRLSRGEKLRDYEARVRCKDGTIRTVQIDSSVLREEGRFVHTQCFTRDISERKRNEAAMAGLAAIVGSSADAIVGCTLDGTITSWNRAAEQIYGFTAAEAIGRNITLVVPSDKRAEEAEVLARLRRGDRIEHFETERGTKDGRRIPISLSASPIRNESGAIIGVSKIARDITEQKLAQVALREADLRKDEFLASLAHELRNPLAPLRTGLQILRMSPENRELGGQTIGIMERQLGQLVRLIDDLLDISRISTGKVVLKCERVTLQKVLTGAVELVQPIARERRQEIVLTFPADSIQLEADPVRLTQVFSNLLNNALKFSPPGKPVRMIAERCGDEAIVSVTDEGVGIPAALLSKVFEPFVQVDGGNPGENSGLGIGLTLVKRFVELHGGTVEAKSEGTGAGATFVVRLPGSATEAAPIAVERPNLAAAAKPRRILLVDDNRDAANSLGELLKLLGHEISIAYDGPEAIEAVRRVNCEFVILDIGMPGMSGYEVCKRIKQSMPHPPVVIALTGWGQDADRQRSAAAGFDGHLVKPVELDALIALLERHGS